MDEKKKDINFESISKIRNLEPLHREEILKKFSNEHIKMSWELFCTSILRNYQLGKGTVIPSFGTFTFTDYEVNLQGTTNEIRRDVKLRKPVFIVSNEFVEFLKPGIHTKSGLIHYQQKLNNAVSHVKVNYSEISLGLELELTQAKTLLDNLLKFIADSIRKGTFRNKEMPGLGVLLFQNNTLAVKFETSLTLSISSAPQRIIQTKKDVNLFMKNNEDFKGKTNFGFFSNKNINSLSKSLCTARPQTTILTKITNSGEKWLKENLEVNLDNVSLNTSVRSAISDNNEKIKFLNDRNKRFDSKKTEISQLNLKKATLEALNFNKAIILRQIRARDIRNKGFVSKNNIIEIFLQLNLADELDSHKIGEIINLYPYLITENNDVEYKKFYSEFFEGVNLKLINEKQRASTTNKLVKSVGNFDTKSNSILPNITSIKEDKKNNQVELNEVIKELRTIKIIIPKLKEKNAIRLDQNLSFSELQIQLRDFNIAYPSELIIKILRFLELNPNVFSVNSFISQINKCKIISNEVNYEDFALGLKKIKDIIYLKKQSAEELFENKQSISFQNFLNLIQKNCKDQFLTDEIIKSVFLHITKMDREMNISEFKKEFYLPEDPNFESIALNVLDKKIKQRNFTVNEYFDHLLTYNKYRHDGKISRPDFHKALLNEGLGFSSQNLDSLFNLLDTKNDGVLDRDEWNLKKKSTTEPLYKMQDLIRKNNLEIEDIMFRMQIDLKKNEEFDIFKFKTKMRLLDSQYENNYLTALFESIKNKKETVDTKTLINCFNVFKKESFRDLNFDSFRKNFIDNLRNVTQSDIIIKSFEKVDSLNQGLLDKIEFCKVIQKYTKEYKDEDIMRFIRITQLFQDHKMVKYPQFVELVFYDNQVNFFNKIISVLKNEFIKNKCNINQLIFSINSKKSESVEIEQMFQFLKTKIKDLSKNIVCKLDIDQDGIISNNDLKGIIERYIKTSFFKYDNNDEKLEINLHTKEQLSNEKYREIVKDIKKALKNKNLTDVGLFMKLDSNNDGLISNVDFSKNIEDVVLIAPAIKDKFFNTLDVRRLGEVDLETFLSVFREYSGSQKPYENDWTVENKIIKEFHKFILENSSLNENQILSSIDYDFDGKITVPDFRRFIIEKLRFLHDEFNDLQVERSLHYLSITKSKFIGLKDIRKICEDLRKSSKKKIENIQTLSNTVTNFPKDKEKSTFWIDSALEKFGLYITDTFETVENFFRRFASEENKMKFEDFEKFVKSNIKCFEGLNLTRDEYLTLFSAIDSHKKNFINKDDLMSKAGIFNFLEKMKREFKTFFKTSFKSPTDAYRYFLRYDDPKTMKRSDSFNSLRINDNTTLSKKDLFEGINRLFHSQFTTNQILSFISNTFNNSQNINFSKFTYEFFDQVKGVNFLKQSFSKLSENKIIDKDLRSYSAKERLVTPFDHDPVEKFRRMLKSSKYEAREFLREVEKISNGKVNQFEFRSMIKKMNLGFGSKEIDVLLSKMEKDSEGLINIKDFVNFSLNPPDALNQIDKNISEPLGYIKQLIYKYYSNPIMCFQFNDQRNLKSMNFETFNRIISSLYEKETKPLPNYSIIKNIFDYIDIRKDGIIDSNEWSKVFSIFESNLESKKSNPFIISKLRSWENSDEVSGIYKVIFRNRKIIKEAIRENELGKEVQSEILLKLIKTLLPKLQISNAQWKIIVGIADKEKNGNVSVKLFFDLIEKANKINDSHPLII